MDASAESSRGPEPPAKRRRLDNWQDPNVFLECAKHQVFPHVDRAIAQLPKTVNTDIIGELTVLFLTSDPTGFAQEYRRGNGTISADFERRLASLAVSYSRTLAQLSEYQTGPRPPETPVPVPRLPPSSVPRVEAAKKPYIPRHSTSPIPPPPIPRPLPAKPTRLQEVSTNGVGDAFSPILIDDSDDEKLPSLRPSAPQHGKGVAVPQPQAPKNEPKPNIQTPTQQPVRISGPAKHVAPVTAPTSLWFRSSRHPYITAQRRALVAGGNHKVFSSTDINSTLPVVYHVDFTHDELCRLRKAIREVLDLKSKKKKHVKSELGSLLRRNVGLHQDILDFIQNHNILPKRTRADITNVFRDLSLKHTAEEPLVLTLEKDDGNTAEVARSSRIDSLLFRREVSGVRSHRAMRRLVNFSNEFKVCREDDLALRAEWTDCAGDIITITWVSDDAFICGMTEHSDAHNQQYNKPGNLVLGSCSQGTVRAFPDHRIVRPIVDHGENGTEAMRQSQDPWLYSSVVASVYDAAHRRAFTSGFDRTVKIWDVGPGPSMRAIGEWKHGGNVNFVAASRHKSGMVATASDVATDAVRIYMINDDDPSGSPYRTFSCSRVTDAEGNTVSTEKWAYFPATMQWGVAEGVQHLLLVGYSPRSRTGDDSHIPEDRLKTGELCLWDGLTGERWRLTSATTQNVFEVLWHPTQHSFIAATSPLGLEPEDRPRVRTQIRIFRPSDHQEYGGKAFTPVQTLDCSASDINELTIMPNSFTYCYITAGCTDGNIYVWDTALGDKPIHVLRHGDCIEELFSGDREREDVGVKFTAWGTTMDRFYTGSSDGVVKVWNVRSVEKPLVRTLLEVPAQVSCGMFSPDRTKLLIGDASGRIFLLSLDEEGVKPAPYRTLTLPGGMGVKRIREPIPIIHHEEPPPPDFDAQGRPLEVETGHSRARAYLVSQQLQRHPDPTIGVVQGPRYAETGLYLPEAHLNRDPEQPLVADWPAIQLEDRKMFPAGIRGQFRPLRPVREAEGLEDRHTRNTALDLDISSLSLETRVELEDGGVDFALAEEYCFDYEA